MRWIDHGAALFHEITKSSGVPCHGGLYFPHLKVHSRWYSGLSVTNFLGVQYFVVVKSVILIRHGTLHVACHPVSNCSPKRRTSLREEVAVVVQDSLFRFWAGKLISLR